MSKLPIEMINLICSYMSHPIADIFKKEVKEIEDIFKKEFKEAKGIEFDEVDEMEGLYVNAPITFAAHYFYSQKWYEYEYDGSHYFPTVYIYYYENMDEDYVSTRNEYYRNH